MAAMAFFFPPVFTTNRPKRSLAQGSPATQRQAASIRTVRRRVLPLFISGPSRRVSVRYNSEAAAEGGWRATGRRYKAVIEAEEEDHRHLEISRGQPWSFAKLPRGSNWGSLYGISVMCGIGFTMSMFIGSLAFESSGMDIQLIFDDRLGTIVGSLASATLAYIVLHFSLPKNK